MYVAPGIVGMPGITLVDRVTYLLSIDIECLSRGCASGDPLCPGIGLCGHVVAGTVESRGRGIVPHTQEIGPQVDDDGMTSIGGSQQGPVCRCAGYRPGPGDVGKVSGDGQAGITRNQTGGRAVKRLHACHHVIDATAAECVVVAIARQVSDRGARAGITGGVVGVQP